MQPKYLIVGQGISGTLLSFEFFKRKLKHKVLDNGHKHSASKAAAGIINPITGRRYVKSWMVEDLIKSAKKVYAELEEILKIRLITHTSIIRTWESQQQANLWMESTSRVGYDAFVNYKDLNFPYQELVQACFGYGEILQAMMVDVQNLIVRYRDFLIESECYQQTDFDISSLKLEADYVVYDQEKYEAVIFCEGYRVKDNPYFSYLPFQPAKGESFKVKIAEQLPDKVLRDKVFIAPLNKNLFWTGGGYEWNQLDENPTEAFKLSWEQKLDALLKVPYLIQDHMAGVRPSVKGRRPIIGSHPQFRRLFIFNGMGTKGTSLAPYWVEKFVDSITLGSTVSDEVSISRFDSQMR